MRTYEFNGREIRTIKEALYRDALNYQALLLKAKYPHQHEYYADHLEDIFHLYEGLQPMIVSVGSGSLDSRMSMLMNWFDEYNQLEAILEV